MSLVLDGTHFDAVKNYIMLQCDTVNSIISRYVQTMNKVIETGIMEGTTAEALKEFLIAVKSDVADNSSTPGAMSSQVERFCTNFIKKVDKADKELY